MHRWVQRGRWHWPMNSRLSFRMRFLAALLLPTTIIFLVLLAPGLTDGRLDSTILLLVVLTIVILLLPWERIRSLKAAGIEIMLHQAQMDRAVETVKGQGKEISDDHLRSLLKRFEPQIEQTEGSRILWIDDSPYNILGERRLLRTLGLEIVMAESSETAREYLRRDGDFDLIISDMRGKDQHPPEAVRFIQEDLRQAEDARRRAGNYEHIPLVPVVFYSGHPWQEYHDLIRDLRSAESIVVWTSGVEQLVQEILVLLYHIRLEPRRFVQNPDRTMLQEEAGS
jgi:CheY-like chemotaxis protein